MELIIIRNVNNASRLIRAYSNSSPLRNVRLLCQFNDTRWTSKLKDDNLKLSIVPQTFPTSSSLFKNLRNDGFISKQVFTANYSTEPKDQCKAAPQQVPEEPKKVNIFQKMKQLTKDYWHILIPVHMVTSVGWASLCYVAAKNGVDVIAIMEWLHISEKYINILKNSNAGVWAVTYALYKLLTPLRYTVTVGGTTFAIRYLDRLGIMKFRRSTEATRTSSTSAASKKNSNESKNLKSN